MFKEYNKKTNELFLSKSKFYKVDENPGFVNEELADDLKEFIEHGFVEKGYVDLYLSKLKECMVNVDSELVKSIRVADIDVRKVNINGLWYYNVRALLTYNGDTRDLSKIINTYKSAAVDSNGQKNFSYLENGEEITDGEYLTLFSFPVPSKNCTWKMFGDKYADREDGREFYFRLQLKQAPGLYLSTKAGDPVLILHNDVTKFTIEKTTKKIKITDSNSRIENNKLSLDILELLPYLYSISSIDGKSPENYYMHIDALKEDSLLRAITDRYGQLKVTNKETVDKLNKTHFIENLVKDISNIDGIEALTSLIGSTLSRATSLLPEGTTITEDNINQAPTSGLVYVRCGAPLGYNITETEVPIEAIARAIPYCEELRDTQFESMMIKGTISEDGTKFILAPQEITRTIQDILIRANHKFVQTFSGKVYLERPVFLTPVNEDNLFYVMLNIISLMRAVYAGDNSVKFNTLDLRSSFNRYVYTPRMILEDSIKYAWNDLFRVYKSRIESHAVAYATSLKEILKDNTIADNPIGTMNKCIIQKLRRRMDRINTISYVTVNATTNPIQYVSCLRQVDIKVKDSHSIAFEDRQLHPSMLGRIDMFEVPLGPKLGVSTHLTKGCIIGHEGEMNVKYRKVVNGQITNEIVYLKAIEEHNYVISSMSDLDIDDNGRILNTKKVFAKVQSIYNKWNVDIELVDPSEIQLVSYSIDSEFSWSVSSIPFIGNNDSARITYGVSQLKQAKSLITREAPIVRTESWKTIPKVQDVFTSIRTVSNARFCLPQVNQADHSLNIQYHKGLYDITDSAFSDVECSMIKDGVICVGRNALIAFVPDGSTYEDSVHISSDFADKLISYRIDTYKSDEVRLKRSNDDKSINQFPTEPSIYTKSMLRRVLTSGEPLTKTLVNGKNVIYKSNKEGLILRVAHSSESVKLESSQDKSDLVEHCIKYSVLKINRLECGDKLSNRHANKGVLSYSSPDKEIGVLYNGAKIEAIYNVMGVISRMNLGQIYEAKLGLIGKVLGININVNSIAGITRSDIQELMSATHRLANSGDSFESELLWWSSISNELVDELRKNKIQILSWANTFDDHGCAFIKGINRKVLIGVMYINKLTQESETKSGMRGGILSGERYTQKTQEPVKGAKDNGGQRVGNMEVDAYIAYGANDLLRKLYNERGNNVKRRLSYIGDVLNKNNYETLNQTKDLLDIRMTSAEFICTMKAMGIDIIGNTDNSLTKIIECKKLNRAVRERFLYGIADVKQNNGLTTESILMNSKNAQIIEIEKYLKSQGQSWDVVKNEISPIGGTIESRIDDAIKLWEMEARNPMITEPYKLISLYRNNVTAWTQMDEMYKERASAIEKFKEQTESEFVGFNKADFLAKPLVDSSEEKLIDLAKKTETIELTGTQDLVDLFNL